MSAAALPILIVDDELDNRTLIRRLLEFNGFRVVEARNGVEALEMARLFRPGLVLLDLSMPFLDGWQTARQFRTDPQLARTPILAVSANAMNGDAASAVAAGCDEFIAKPIEINDFINRIRSYL